MPADAPIEGAQASGATCGGDRHVLVIDRDADTGKMNLSLGLQQRESLTSGSWSNVMINEADITIQGGRLQIGVTPAGNAAFYRVQGGVDE